MHLHKVELRCLLPHFLSRFLFPPSLLHLLLALCTHASDQGVSWWPLSHLPPQANRHAEGQVLQPAFHIMRPFFGLLRRQYKMSLSSSKISEETPPIKDVIARRRDR